MHISLCQLCGFSEKQSSLSSARVTRRCSSVVRWRLAERLEEGEEAWSFWEGECFDFWERERIRVGEGLEASVVLRLEEDLREGAGVSRAFRLKEVR